MELTSLERYWRDVFDRSSSVDEEDHIVSRWSEHGLTRRLDQFKLLNEKLGVAKADALVLDAGCGPGTYAIELARNESKIVALDFSQQMVRRARTNVLKQPRKLEDKISFAVGNVKSLPVRSNTLDSVVCYGVLQHVSDAEPVVKEFYRVLKAGGYCVINALNKRSLFRRKVELFRYYDPLEFQRFCLGVGFRSAEVSRLTLFPKPLRVIERIDSISLNLSGLWLVAHDFTVVLKKP